MDRDAGHEEPWGSAIVAEYREAQKRRGPTAREIIEAMHAEQKAADVIVDTMQWGAERNLYSRQLQDANKRIHELEKELLKLREDMRKLMHAAAHPPQIEDEPVAFPARALRFSA